MSKSNLTLEKLRKLKPGIHWEGNGFGVRVGKLGHWTFVVKYRVGVKQVLGTVARIKRDEEFCSQELKGLRHTAMQWQTEGRDGINAVAERQAMRKARAEAQTVAELAEEWLVKHAQGLVSEAAIAGYIRNDIIPALGDMRIENVRKINVLDMVEQKAATTTRAAAILLNYTRMLMEYAVTRDIIPANPVAGLKPKDIKVQGKRNALAPVHRKRVLSNGEIKQLWKTNSLQALTKLAMQLTLITGQRPGEVAGMHWDEIKDRIWTIPAGRRGKTETEHSVYLSDMAIEVISQADEEVERLRKRRGTTRSGYIFESVTGGPIRTDSMSKALKRAQLVGGDAWTPHDLRRTMRTGLAAAKVQAEIAELVVGHTKKGIVAVYDQHSYEDEKREAHEAWERRLKCILSDDQNPDFQKVERNMRQDLLDQPHGMLEDRMVNRFLDDERPLAERAK